MCQQMLEGLSASSAVLAQVSPGYRIDLLPKIARGSVSCRPTKDWPTNELPLVENLFGEAIGELQ
jgi:hypothetical protein